MSEKGNNNEKEDEKSEKGKEKNKEKPDESKKEKNNGESDKPSPSSALKIEETPAKKEKRTLRFEFPEPRISVGSIIPTIPDVPVTEVREGGQSVLKKYALTPDRRHEVRGALPRPCFSHEDLDLQEARMHNSTFPEASESSHQLFEITRTSPTPSNEDVNLLNATYMRRLDKMKEAVAAGANVNIVRGRQSPLMVATEMGDERLVRYLLSVRNINTDIQNVYGQTPVTVAVKNASDEILQMLLNHNADVNVPDNMGRTPLHEALFQGRPNIVKLLLAFGANSDESDHFGERPMYTVCVKKPNLECLNILLNSGATPEYANTFGLTLLSRAIVNFTDFEIIKTLVNSGASVNSIDLNTGKAPLHFTAMINDVRIAEFLLKQSADANMKTFYGFTPYDEAIFHKSYGVAQCLFPYTANASLKQLNSMKTPSSC